MTLASTDASINELTVEERQQLAHLSESVAAYQFFHDVKNTPITQQEARRIAFISWLVFRRLLSEYPDWEQRPRRFVSHDPRRSFQW